MNRGSLLLHNGASEQPSDFQAVLSGSINISKNIHFCSEMNARFICLRCFVIVESCMCVLCFVIAENCIGVLCFVIAENSCECYVSLSLKLHPRAVFRYR